LVEIMESIQYINCFIYFHFFMLKVLASEMDQANSGLI
jgi:hypothetical protein